MIQKINAHISFKCSYQYVHCPSYIKTLLYLPDVPKLRLLALYFKVGFRLNNTIYIAKCWCRVGSLVYILSIRYIWSNYYDEQDDYNHSNNYHHLNIFPPKLAFKFPCLLFKLWCSLLEGIVFFNGVGLIFQSFEWVNPPARLLCHQVLRVFDLAPKLSPRWLS